MKRKILNLSRRYQAALQTHLRQGQMESPASMRGLGSEALAAGLQLPDLAKLHEQTVVMEMAPGGSANQRAALLKRAGIFFSAAMTPIEKTPRGAREAAVEMKKLIGTLSQRTVELAASNRDLRLEITRRKAMEKSFKKRERQHSQLLEQSDRSQEEARRLSRQILSAQEDERKRISRELHDVIAQMLTGINVRLATLKKEVALNNKGLDRNIARTQMLVEKSVNTVHEFARELRPAVLDDLGLIPALHSFMKNFTARTGVRTRLTAFAGVEQLDTARRTVLFRVAQEALTNVASHAQASRVEVSIRKLPGCICMKIKDNGKSFHVQSVLRGEKRLGLLGMRERMEMVGGHLDIESSPGKGSTITARIAPPKAARGIL
jgi:signal transduction histidine kinase